MGKRSDYICVDLETTGLNPGTDRIIEIGAVFVRDGQIVDTFDELVRPCMALSDHVTEITGITEEMLQGARKIHDVIIEYELFEQRSAAALEMSGEMKAQTGEFLPLLGHAVYFDYSFLKRAFVNEGMQYEREAIDTLKIARKYLGGLPSRSLSGLTDHYAIRHQPHRAFHDAEATYQLYEKMWDEFKDQEDAQELFAPVRMNYHVKRQSPIRPGQKERLAQLMERHHITPDVEIDSLMRSEADRMIDRILAQYGK